MMKRSNLLIVTASLLAVGVSGGGAAAQRPQFRETVTVRGMVAGAARDHHLTFSAPIALPGVSLGAGTYIFSRPTTGVLWVLGADREPYATLHTVPATRTRGTDRYEIVLGPPLGDGSPRRLLAWFPRGEPLGQELIYPAAR